MIGPPPQCRSRNAFEDDTTDLRVGVWDSTPYERHGRAHKLNELMHLIEGLLGNNTPVFFFRDPLGFPDLNPAVKRDPRTGMRNTQSNWDLFNGRITTIDSVQMRPYLSLKYKTPDAVHRALG